VILQQSVKFLWIKRKIQAEQMQAVHRLAQTACCLPRVTLRLYPTADLAGNIMGGPAMAVRA